MKIDHFSFTATNYDRVKEKPTNAIEAIMADIVMYAEKKLTEGLLNPMTGLEQLHPKTIIAMLVTNLIINLSYKAIVHDVNTPAMRLAMIENLMAGIVAMVMDCWTIVETQRADTGSAQ